MPLSCDAGGSGAEREGTWPIDGQSSIQQRHEQAIDVQTCKECLAKSLISQLRHSLPYPTAWVPPSFAPDKLGKPLDHGEPRSFYL